jgi:hypothetical protein
MSFWVMYENYYLLCSLSALATLYYLSVLVLYNFLPGPHKIRQYAILGIQCSDYLLGRQLNRAT